MIKSAFGILLLPIMALATLFTPLSNSSNALTPLSSANSTNDTKALVHRQIGPQAHGSSCVDEGAWFSMSTNFQRCASGEWSIVQDCAPGTQCEPLGITHNASQPAFGIYDGNGGTTTTDASTTTFGIDPVTKTTTTDIVVTQGPSTSSSTLKSSFKSVTTGSATSTTSASSSILSAVGPKADTSTGARLAGLSWSTMCMIFYTWILAVSGEWTAI